MANILNSEKGEEAIRINWQIVKEVGELKDAFFSEMKKIKCQDISIKCLTKLEYDRNRWTKRTHV